MITSSRCYMSCRREKKKDRKEGVIVVMKLILQHKDGNYQCPLLGASCPFVGQEMVVKETMGEQHDTRQV